MAVPTPRTTSDLVTAILPAVQPGFDLTPCIALANQIVTGVCTQTPPALPDGTIPAAYTDGFEGSQLELIERYLAAHFYTVSDNQDAAVGVGQGRSTFQGRTDFGLKSSFFGQAAIRADFYGFLAAWDNTANTKRQIQVSIGHIGKRRPRCGGYWGGYVGDDDIATVEQ